MVIREASVRDSHLVIELVSAMLQDMASYGGHALNNARQVNTQLRSSFSNAIEKEDHVFLLAVLEQQEELIGVVEASVGSADEVFRPKPVLHVHALYVKTDHRGRGVGRKLLEAVLDWGKEKGCVEAELNVLANNPARALYESAGFAVFELEMRRGL